MAGIRSCVRNMVRICGMLTHHARNTSSTSTCRQHGLISSLPLMARHSRATLQPYWSSFSLGSVLFRQFSNNLFSTRYCEPCAPALCTALRYMYKSPPAGSVGLPVCTVPVRTVVKHSKLGKMKTVKAVAKRFRRTGSGKLKFWPPGNVHNLLSKSQSRKGRIRRARYVNKTQLKTLNKMLIGRYS